VDGGSWDTAGQEQFRCISKAYFRGASGSILAFDLSSKESFDNTRTWLEEVLREVPAVLYHQRARTPNAVLTSPYQVTPGHKVFLVGLKDDLPVRLVLHIFFPCLDGGGTDRSCWWWWWLWCIGNVPAAID
jgi:GTPase SAR1 family protein